LGAAFHFWQSPTRAAERDASGAEREASGKISEELVYAESSDGIVNEGAIFSPPKDSAKPIAIIWIHGSGASFCRPQYVKIGRALAALGYACIDGNTRKHDLGTRSDGEKTIYGGSLWGKESEQVHDLAAWIDLAMARGFKGVVLVGHSAGSNAVRRYQAQKQDRRVAGIVSASGGVRFVTRLNDPELLARAKRLLADGRGHDLLRVPNQPNFDQFISAATIVDFANIPLEQKDFFGVETPNPAVTRVRCPILAFYGTKEPGVGTAADLELLKSCVKRQESGPSRVDTVMIPNATHEYDGVEADVAKIIAQWADTLALPK
jgi:pimeloyl-ACP methyl ester carboxylesterase